MRNIKYKIINKSINKKTAPTRFNRLNVKLKDQKIDFLVKLKEVLYNRRKFGYSSSDYIYEVL